MTTKTVTLPRLHPQQQAAEAAAKRFNIYCCGRRWGKDVLLMRRKARMVGERKPLGWFAPTYRMMTENYKQLHSILAPIITRDSMTDHVLEIEGGASIEFWSLDNYDAARGRRYYHVTINEAAMAGNLMDAWNYVIRPTLMDYRGGLDMSSTPKGYNAFSTFWNQAENNSDWARVHYTTYDNPYIPASEIQALKEILPARAFQQEILAEFVADGSYFQNIDACCVLDAPDMPEAHPGHTFGLGIDWGQSNDFTVGTVGCRECDRAVDWFRFNGLSYPVQRARIVEYVKKWPGVRVLPERNSIGGPNIDDLRLVEWEMNGKKQYIEIALGPDGQHGFNTSATTKPMLIEQLYLALQRGRKYPKEYADEFRAYEVTMRANGAPSFSAPASGHDDRCISAALENYLSLSALQVF
jgi:hypothetical protein